MSSTIKPIFKLNFEQTDGTFTDLTGNGYDATATPANAVTPVAHDPEMGRCLQFNGTTASHCTISKPLSDPALSNGLTMTTWINVTAYTETPIMLQLADGSQSINLQVGSGSPYYFNSNTTPLVDPNRISLGTWHHIAVTVDTSGKVIIYVDGKETVKGTNTKYAVDAHFTTTAIQIGSQKFNGMMAWMALYDGPLGPTEILADMAEGQSKRASSFRQSTPIDFKLYSDDGGAENPIMFIEDEGAGENLNLRVINNSLKPISYQKNLDPVSSTNYHFQLRFRPGVLSKNFLANYGQDSTAKKPKNLPKLLADNPNWSAVVNGGADSIDTISFLYNGDNTPPLGKGENDLIVVSAVNASATGGSRNTNVELRYQNIQLGAVTTPIKGHRKQNISIVNHSGDKDIPLRAEIVGNASVMTYAKPASGAKVKNPPQTDLMFRIVNTGSKSLPLALPDNPDGPTIFTLSIDVQPEGHLVEWALIDQGVVDKISLSLNKLGVVRSVSGTTLTLEGPLIEALKAGTSLQVSGASEPWTVATPGASAGDYQIPLTTQPSHPHIGADIELKNEGSTWLTKRVKAKDNNKGGNKQVANETSLPGKELWTITNQSLANLEKGAGLSFILKDIECSLPAGSSVVTISYHNVPGHWDGQFELPIERSPMAFNENLIGINTNEPTASLHIVEEKSITPIRIEDNQVKSFPAPLKDIGTRISQLIPLNEAEQTYYDPILIFGSSSYTDVVLNIWTINGGSSSVTPIALPTNNFSSANASKGNFAGRVTFHNGYFYFIGWVTSTVLVYQYSANTLTYKGEGNNYTTTYETGGFAPQQSPQIAGPIAAHNKVLYAVGGYQTNSIISYSLDSAAGYGGSVTVPHGYDNSFKGTSMSGRVWYFLERQGYLYILTANGFFVGSIDSSGTVTVTGSATLSNVPSNATIQLYDDYAYIISGSTIVIIDIKDTSSLIAYPPINIAEPINTLVMRRGALLVCTKKTWFLYNVSSPGSPELIRSLIYKKGFEVTEVDVFNNTFCVTGGEIPANGSITSFTSYFYDAEKAFDFLTGVNTFITANKIAINTGVIQENATLSIPYPSNTESRAVLIGDSISSQPAAFSMALPENTTLNPVAITNNDGGTLLTVTENGSVGIGTDDPKAPLHVESHIVDAIMEEFITYRYGSISSKTNVAKVATQTNRADANMANISIRASHKIRASQFYAISDVRTKEFIISSDAVADLATLLNLQVSDYQHIDFVGKGSGQKKGLIAQQVKEVYPQAVNEQSTDFIPDIYAMATDVAWQPITQHLRVSLEKAHGLAVGDKVRLIAEKGFEEKKVVALPNDHSFVVADWEKPVHKLFVFGKEVHDFHTVDYDQVAMLGVSAIQTLHEKVEKQDEKIAALEREIVELKTERASELTEIREELKAFKAAVSRQYEN